MVKLTQPGSRSPKASVLEVIPLGGLGEFGLNMMLYRLGDDIIVVDAGVMFPSAENPGVDLQLPDTSYLDAHRDLVRGVVLTHGHEDHIGALPYLLREHRVPVCGTKLTLGLCRRRLEEHGLLDRVELREVAPGERARLGAFAIEFIYMSHSLADAVALAIETPLGIILHTGDFKIDEAPPVGPPIDIKRLGELGSEGVLCLLSDSTNAEVPGRTGAEASVVAGFEAILSDAPGRVFLSCFTSSTHRLQVAFDVAAKHGRRVTLVGRSMVENVQIAMNLGYLRAPSELLWPVEDVSSLPRTKQLVITAGSQGEPMSALAQVAAGTHRFAVAEPGDRVILSARTIPGNEKAVNRIVNHLFKLGVEVFYPPKAQVHVSGHGSAEDLAMLLRLVKPRHFVPIHGEWRQLFHHAKIARETGVAESSVFLAEDGDVLRFDGDGARVADRIETGRLLVDGSGLGLVEDCVVRDRRRLAAAGLLVPMISLNGAKELDVSDILSRGFIENEEGEALIAEAHDLMVQAVRGLPPGEERTERAVEEVVETTLKRFFRKRSVRRPVIVPVVVSTEGSGS
jgi:ribonuclease J